MLPVGRPDHIDDALGPALEDQHGLAACEIVNPHRVRIFRLLVRLGRIRDAIAVGRERRPSVLSAASGLACAGAVVGEHDRPYRLIALDVNRSRLAGDAFWLRALRVAVVDIGVGADVSDRAGRLRAMSIGPEYE